MRAIKNFFTALFVKLHLIKPKTFVVRQHGTLLGSVSAYNELHALEVIAQSFGHKTFEDFCRVLGIAPEAHKVEATQ